jgi:hypothetical protein
MPERQRPPGKVIADYVSGEMGTGDRRRRLARLAHPVPHSRRVLSNARCLAEGVDVPTLDGVAFIDPRRSKTDIVQAVGRAIRKAPDKKVGTIVLPVFIDTADDPESVLDGSNFRPVWEVIRALRAHDEDLAESLDALRRELGRNGSIDRLPQQIVLDLPIQVPGDFVEKFDAHLVQASTNSWNYWFGALQKYVAEHGDARVTSRDRLGNWVNTQRAFYRNGQLSAERANRLGSLPYWFWHYQDDAWDRACVALETYATANGMPAAASGTVVDGVDIGRWVNKQRTYRARLSVEQQRRLEAIPLWSWSPRDDRWNEGFRRLVEYSHKSGTTRLRALEVVDGYRLGNWARKQRDRRALLSAERVAALGVDSIHVRQLGLLETRGC